MKSVDARDPGAVASQMRVDVMHAVPPPRLGARGKDRPIADACFFVFRRSQIRNRESGYAAPVDWMDILREAHRSVVDYDDSAGWASEMRVVRENRATGVL